MIIELNWFITCEKIKLIDDSPMLCTDLYWLMILETDW